MNWYPASFELQGEVVKPIGLSADPFTSRIIENQPGVGVGRGGPVESFVNVALTHRPVFFVLGSQPVGIHRLAIVGHTFIDDVPGPHFPGPGFSGRNDEVPEVLFSQMVR